MPEVKDKDYYLTQLKAYLTQLDAPGTPINRSELLHTVIGNITLRAIQLENEDDCNQSALEAAENALVKPLEAELRNLNHPERHRWERLAPSQGDSTTKLGSELSAREILVSEQESLKTQPSASL